MEIDTCGISAVWQICSHPGMVEFAARTSYKKQEFTGERAQGSFNLLDRTEISLLPLLSFISQKNKEKHQRWLTRQVRLS